jgi:hypothetical protein
MALTDAQIANLTPEQITQLEENPDAEAEILAGLEGKPSKDSEEDHEQEEDEGAANGAVETEEDEPEEEQDEEKDEPVVLTKDGKRTIPYSEHKELRVKVAELTEKLNQLPALEKARDELQALKQKKSSAKTPERRAEIQKKVDDRIKRLSEDFPEAGETADSIREYVDAIAEELKAEREANAAREQAAKEEQERQIEEQKRIINEKVQEAKENNPDLIHWEKNDPQAWEEALAQDNALLQIPKWQKKSYEERFLEVVKRVRSIMPEASEPPNAEPSANAKQKANAKLAKAPVKKPTTLSDIQGGANPMSEAEQINNLPPHELFKRLMKMPDQKAAAMRAELD